ncbi:hypothetical protein DPX16_19860 [Anabarilius grahami]|uniref:Uncharacterized protein n=1 Tax=Anabarilius grahami TaxID=495550 RepID=A0A3N0Y7L8_ANAGA|nr:hypothetical protein DPX16_19860 [Anabarilius grahami]
MADFKTLLHEDSEDNESAYRIMIRIVCQTAKLLKSRYFGAPNCGFNTLIHYALKLHEARPVQCLIVSHGSNYLSCLNLSGSRYIFGASYCTPANAHRPAYNLG